MSVWFYLWFLLSALLMSLYGTVFLYQGEELGLPEARLQFEELQDPWGKHLWPRWQGRDGCRTPMPWNDEMNAGFSSGKPWLPVPATHLPLNAEAQEGHPQSVLAFTKEFIHWRRTRTALRNGSIDFINTGGEKLLAFTRIHEKEKLLCVFNLDEGGRIFDILGQTGSLSAYEFSIRRL